MSSRSISKIRLILSCLVIAGVALVTSPARSQEAAHAFFASDAAPVRGVAVRKGRGQLSYSASWGGDHSAIARAAARHVGATGPALGLSSRLWCADYANKILRETGYRTVNSRRAIDMQRAGPRVSDPRPGDLMITGRRGGAHVSIIARVQGRFAWTYNGNGRYRRVSESLRPLRGIIVRPQRA